MQLRLLLCVILLSAGSLWGEDQPARTLLAGVGKVDISNPRAKPHGTPLYAKALVLSDGITTVALVTIDAVALGEIGSIKKEFLGHVRGALQQDLGIAPSNVLINASHCHGVVCDDIESKTVQAVQEAWEHRVPVTAGTGKGYEDRIMENRRIRLKNGRETDVRHAYSLPPDEEMARVGPVDPEIGVLRLDRTNGATLAVVYNFACHPIQGIPSGGNTSDITGFASQVIEDNLSEGSVALFVQGCAGDINPVLYKEVHVPRDAEPLGHLLGLSTLKAIRKIQPGGKADLRLLNEIIRLPRADHTKRIASLQTEQARLLQSLQGTSLNLKTFLELLPKYRAPGAFPSYYAYGYLRDKSIGKEDWINLDAQNQRNVEEYIKNIHVMEELTRLQANLALLQMHQAQNVAAGTNTVDAEIVGLRVGDFVLLTFPGELTVQIGLNIKQRAPHQPSFVAGYTNGYLFYAPTDEQALNGGFAQEDCDCLLAPGWQALFENQAADMLRRLGP